MSAYVKVSDLKLGDTIVRECGRRSRILSIEKGFIHGSVFLGYRNDDWSCVAVSDEIEVVGSRDASKGGEG